MQFDPHVDVTDGYQTRPAGWQAAELDPFADALEAVLKTGKHDLASLVEGLNAGGVTPPAGAAWTAASLTARLAELDRV